MKAKVAKRRFSDAFYAWVALACFLVATTLWRMFLTVTTTTTLPPSISVESDPPRTVANEDKTDAWKLVERNAPTKRTSAAHCTLSTMNSEAWRGNACFYRRLCHHRGKFQFYIGESSSSRDKRDSASSHASGSSSSSSSVIENVTAARLGEGEAFDYVAFPDHVQLGQEKYLPEVIRSDLPYPRYEPRGGEDETWVIFSRDDFLDPSNEVEFVRDGLFGIWLLSKNVPWTPSSRVRPLEYVAASTTSASHDSPSFLMKWFDVLFGEGAARIAAEAMNEARVGLPRDLPVCFPKVASGMAAMTTRCLAPTHDVVKDKDSVSVNALSCAMGRGALFWELRREILQSSSLKARGGHSTDSDPSPHATHIVLTSPLDSSTLAGLKSVVDIVATTTKEQDMKTSEWVGEEETWLGALGARLVEDLISARSSTIRVRLIRPAIMSLQEHIEVMRETCVFVTRPQGNESLPGHLLPRWSSVALVRPESRDTWFLSSSSASPGFPYYGYWENLGYVRVAWKTRDEIMGKQSASFLDWVREELVKCRELADAFEGGRNSEL